MNAIITINDSNQDKSLRVAFDIAMQEKNWNTILEVENTYFKNFESTDHHKVNKLVAQDVDEAIFDAEWEKLKYIVVTTETMYYVMETK